MRGIVKELDRHTKAVQKAKKGADARQRKRMSLHIKKLRKVRAFLTDCDAFAPPI